MFKCQNNHKLLSQVDTSVSLKMETFHDDGKQEKLG